MRIPRTYLAAIALVGVALMLAQVGALDPGSALLMGAIGSTQLTPGGARVIDPILTNLARGFRNPDFVGDALFPAVPVDQRGGKVIEFRKEDFQLYATGRVPGANTRRVQYGYDGAAFALEQHALEGVVPFEILAEANAVPGIDMARVAVAKTQNIIALRLEKARADIARTAASYPATNKLTLAGASQWSDFGAVSDPSKDIEDAKEAVRAQIGRRPNTVLIGAAVYAKLKQHPKIIDRVKFTGRDSITTDLLASLWSVQRVVVGEAVFANQAGIMSDVWGKDVVVAYTELGTLQDQGLPSYGYTYQLRNHPIVETPYQDRNAKSWVYPVTDEVQPVLAGATAGFLITAAVA